MNTDDGMGLAGVGHPAPGDAVSVDRSHHTTSTTIRPSNTTNLEMKEVTNDGHPDNMEFLIYLKEIFHAQLPKMPRTYIVRLVLDRRHRSIILLRDGTPIGGITYRPFHEQKFGEIAFCAVVGHAQVQGHGTRLMNELKRVTLRDGLTHLHTYADNYAIGYFVKHGFTKTLTMARDRWMSYVKDYDGGTHMECYMHPTIPYPQLPAMYSKQLEWVRTRISDVAASNRVYPGLPAGTFKHGNVLRCMDIPGVKEAGWGEEELGSRPKNKREAAQDEMRFLWREIERNEHAWPFRGPVDLTEVPDYTQVVAHPIDLSQIKENIEDLDPESIYATKECMKVDLDLMISNCKAYNAQDTDYWAAADALGHFIQELYTRS